MNIEITNLTPKLSEIVQNFLFGEGYIWGGSNTRDLRHQSKASLTVYKEEKLIWLSGDTTISLDARTQFGQLVDLTTSEVRLDYPNKPKKITGPRSLLKFIQAIPATRFCVDTRNNGLGQYCVLGHLDSAYGHGEGRDGFTDYQLAGVNNGFKENGQFVYVGVWGLSAGKKRESKSGKSIKARLVKFLKENL